MKRIEFLSIFITALVILFTLTIGSNIFIFAQQANTDTNSNTNSDTNKSSSAHTKEQECAAREDSIKTRSEHLNELAQNIETKFSNIEQKVEDYYTTKVLPSGKSVSNYDALIGEVDTEKSDVGTKLSDDTSSIESFTCTQSNPKSQLLTYNTNMKDTISQLRNYRNSIKNLIVAVATSSSQGKSSSGTNNSNTGN